MFAFADLKFNKLLFAEQSFFLNGRCKLVHLRNGKVIPGMLIAYGACQYEM